MLTHLQISQFAIVEEESISFGPGLNVISGETGAGKSVVLQALMLIMGARPKAKFIRPGSDGWEISAHFQLDSLPAEVKASLPELLQGDELLVVRSGSANGRGKVFINGRIATVALLEELSSRLLNICGQGQHVSLLDPSYHLELVDGFGELEELLSQYKELFRSWKSAKKELERAQKHRLEVESRREELEQITKDLGGLELEPGLRSVLELELADLKRGQEVIEKCYRAQEILSGRSDGGALSDGVSALTRSVNDLVRSDSRAEVIAERLEDLSESLFQLESELSRYQSSLEVDEESLVTVQDKLAEVARLERKYRLDDGGLAELRDTAEKELLELKDTVQIKDLESSVECIHKDLSKIVRSLSKARQVAAERFVTEVEQELKDVAMAEAKLQVKTAEVEWNESGAERLEFLIQTNPGMAPRPLREIASGGELSRIMLVLKKVLRDKTGVNVLVFDEVDTGISGGVARAVGEKLRDLARSSQVICITHLAQVASLGDHHLLVEKTVQGSASTRIKDLNPEDRIEEIARMLAGYEVTSAARESARELLASKG